MVPSPILKSSNFLLVQVFDALSPSSIFLLIIGILSFIAPISFLFSDIFKDNTCLSSFIFLISSLNSLFKSNNFFSVLSASSTNFLLIISVCLLISPSNSLFKSNIFLLVLLASSTNFLLIISDCSLISSLILFILSSVFTFASPKRVAIFSCKLVITSSSFFSNCSRDCFNSLTSVSSFFTILLILVFKFLLWSSLACFSLSKPKLIVSILLSV